MSRSASACAAALAICPPSSESRKPGSRPYRIFSGLCTSPCRSTCTTVVVTCAAPPRRRRPRRAGQCRGDHLQRRVVERRRHEPRLERARRQVDAARRASRGRTPGTRPTSWAARVVVVGDRRVGEEDREHVAGVRQPVRHPGGGQRVGGELADGGGGRVEARVDARRRSAQRGQAGGAGQRVPGQRAGLVDRAGRGEPAHDLGAAAERRRGQAAAHHLAEGVQVGVDRLEPGPAAAGDPEAGHHLVDDEQRAVRVGDRGPAPALKPSRGATTPMLPGAASVMTAAISSPCGGEGRLDGGEVVVGQHDRVAGRRAGDAGRVGQRRASRRRSRPRRAARRRGRGSSRRT